MYQREMRCPGTEARCMTITFYRLYFTLNDLNTLADYLRLVQKSYVFLFRIILENRCLPPDLTLRISSCRLSSNYINLKCEFFQKNWKVSLKYEGCLPGKRCKDFSRLPAIRLASRHLFSRLFPTAFHRITWFSFGGKPLPLFIKKYLNDK